MRPCTTAILALLIATARVPCLAQNDTCSPRLDAFPVTNSSPADRRAHDIAKNSKRAQENFQSLTNLVNQYLKDKREPSGQIIGWKTDVCHLLEGPEFTVIKDKFEKPEDETKIVADLQKEELIGSAVRSIIPKHEPMSFAAAPGSIWRQHHTYPSGLLQHTLTNLSNALALACAYEPFTQIEAETCRQAELKQFRTIDPNVLVASVIWHDAAKTITIAWKEDGTASPSELPEELPEIAGTSAHHIWAVTEALYRGYPPKFIVALASAHSPAHDREWQLDHLIRYLRAAVIMSGKDLKDAGLRREGQTYFLEERPSIEGFLNHLSDHDYVLSEVALSKTTEVVRDALRLKTTWCAGDSADWKVDRVLAHFGESLYPLLLTEGPMGVEKEITTFVSQDTCGK